jgi:hypothetical protein
MITEKDIEDIFLLKDRNIHGYDAYNWYKNAIAAKSSGQGAERIWCEVNCKNELRLAKSFESAQEK